MGRIKTRLIKAITHELLERNQGSFTSSYEENKAVVTDLAEVRSKKLRNIIAGYATRKVKADQN